MKDRVFWELIPSEVHKVTAAARLDDMGEHSR